MNLRDYWKWLPPKQEMTRQEFISKEDLPESCPDFERIPANPDQSNTYCLECGHEGEMVPIQNLSTIAIRGKTYEDGSVEAILLAAPEGTMWAKERETLTKGIEWLIQTFTRLERQRRKSGNKQSKFDSTETPWIDGEFVARWKAVPGFGVSFPSEETLGPWIQVLLQAAVDAVNAQEKGDREHE